MKGRMRRNAKKGENFFKRNAQKPLTKDEKEDIMKTLRENSALCRRRLAVWRQLPKLFPASSTLVACSKIKVGRLARPTFILALDNVGESNSKGEFCV